MPARLASLLSASTPLPLPKRPSTLLSPDSKILLWPARSQPTASACRGLQHPQPRALLEGLMRADLTSLRPPVCLDTVSPGGNTCPQQHVPDADSHSAPLSSWQSPSNGDQTNPSSARLGFLNRVSNQNYTCAKTARRARRLSTTKAAAAAVEVKKGDPEGGVTIFCISFTYLQNKARERETIKTDLPYAGTFPKWLW